MNKLFVTGMGRSGTTLLERLLTNHSEMDVLSQPFPFLFVNAKRKFLSKKGLDKYFVLNDDLISRCHPQDEFDSFLASLTMDMAQISELFDNMEHYSGQKTKNDFPVAAGTPPINGLSRLIGECLGLYKRETESSYLGSKEIMCEEFLPYLCKNRFKCILIIRDPRDVLASANYPKREKYIGDKKPTLFLLRSWRKSVEYAYLLRNNTNLHLLRYEDLVENPYRELDRITDFLGVSRFAKNHFDQGILDRNGGLWQSNSSFEVQGSFISNKSIDMYKKILSDDEIRYTEAVCHHELNWLAYHSSSQSDLLGTIRGFCDYGVEGLQDLEADFSSSILNVKAEIKRLEEFNGFFNN